MKKIPIPQIGQQQVNIGPNDLDFKNCPACAGEFFDVAYRQGILSSLNPKNPTGANQTVQVPVIICRHCGHEFGKDVPKKQ